MNKGKVNYWTKEEDEILKNTEGIPIPDVIRNFRRQKGISCRSYAAIYQRICLLRYSPKEIKYREDKPEVPVKLKNAKRGRPVGSKSVNREKPTHVVATETVKEVALPKGMTLDFTGKRITITDTYIKIYI